MLSCKSLQLVYFLLQSGDNAEITDRAKQLVQTKQQEIDKLQTFAGQQGASDNAGSTTQQGNGAEQLTAAIEGTMQQITQQELNGDADHDYAHLLILHFQDAIEMANVEIEQGKNQDLKALAQMIVDENQRQISELENWTRNNSK